MIRNSAKAIIFHEGKILFIKMLKDNKNYYILPGGGQDKFENLQEAVLRECLEETGYAVKVLDILFVRDYIAKNHEFGLIDPGFHQVEFMFECRIDSSIDQVQATMRDLHQIDLEWVALNELRSKNIYPKILREKIPLYYEGKGARVIYLGDVN